MNIQSLSIVVPTKRCVNDCPFCVSRMHNNEYIDSFDKIQIKKRLQFAINNGVNSVILTGTGEALQNKKFLRKLIDLFKEMNNPFPNIELQTTGVMLSYVNAKTPQDLVDNEEWDRNLILLKDIGVNTISLSVSDIFSDTNNQKIIGVPNHLKFKIKHIINKLKAQNFNVRLSINLINIYDNYTPQDILYRVKHLNPDQVTFRKMYFSTDDSPENQWVKDNAALIQTVKNIDYHISSEGEELYRLPFGSKVYSLDGMSIVLDDDCMNKQQNSSLKYIILRENGKLYCRWDDKGSLIF